MRARILTAVAAMLLIVAAVAAITPGVADDAADQRLGDLETRVAALETRVAEPAESTSSSTSSQQNNVSSSSSNSSNNAYTASFSGNGDREIELEIDDEGTYQMTATTTSVFSADLEDAAGESLPGFAIETEDAETVTRSGSLEPGAYVLRVSATATWNVTIVLIAS